MNITKAIVQTNSTQDKYWRVSVIAPGIWDEPSELIPALNSVYLDVNDEVLVLYDDNLYSPIILGKLFTESQTKVDPIGGAPVLFKAIRDGVWIIATLTEQGLVIETSNGTKVEIQNEALGAVTEQVSVTAKSVSVKSDTVEVEGKSITIKGSVKHAGTAVPNQMGAWCGIPACLFSGAPHTSDQTTE